MLYWLLCHLISLSFLAPFVGSSLRQSLDSCLSFFLWAVIWLSFLNLHCKMKGSWVPLLSMVPKILPCTILHVPSFLFTWGRYSWWPQKPCVEDWGATEWKKSHPPVRADILDFVWVRSVLLLSLHCCSFLILLVTAGRINWTKLLLISLSLQHWVPRAWSLDLFSFYPLFLVTLSNLTPLHTKSIFVRFHSPSCSD